jgi:hypothetical protein
MITTLLHLLRLFPFQILRQFGLSLEEFERLR